MPQVFERTGVRRPPLSEALPGWSLECLSDAHAELYILRYVVQETVWVQTGYEGSALVRNAYSCQSLACRLRPRVSTNLELSAALNDPKVIRSTLKQ